MEAQSLAVDMDSMNCLSDFSGWCTPSGAGDGHVAWQGIWLARLRLMLLGSSDAGIGASGVGLLLVSLERHGYSWIA